MVVAKTVFEVGGDLTRRGEILVGGPVHVAHIVSFWWREQIASECDFRIIEWKGELLGSILIKTRNPRLLNSVFECIFNEAW